MNLWQLGLFTAASLLALRSFVTMTNYHQRFTLQNLINEHQQTLRSGGDAETPKAAA